MTRPHLRAEQGLKTWYWASSYGTTTWPQGLMPHRMATCLTPWPHASPHGHMASPHTYPYLCSSLCPHSLSTYSATSVPYRVDHSVLLPLSHTMCIPNPNPNPNPCPIPCASLHPSHPPSPPAAPLVAPAASLLKDVIRKCEIHVTKCVICITYIVWDLVVSLLKEV